MEIRLNIPYSIYFHVYIYTRYIHTHSIISLVTIKNMKIFSPPGVPIEHGIISHSFYFNGNSRWASAHFAQRRAGACRRANFMASRESFQEVVGGTRAPVHFNTNFNVFVWGSFISMNMLGFINFCVYWSVLGCSMVALDVGHAKIVVYSIFNQLVLTGIVKWKLSSEWLLLWVPSGR